MPRHESSTCQVFVVAMVFSVVVPSHAADLALPPMPDRVFGASSGAPVEVVMVAELPMPKRLLLMPGTKLYIAAPRRL